MSRTVTVGLDGSPESVAAAGWAAREALLLAAPLRLVHAGDQPPYGYTPFAGEAVAPPDADRAARMLREVEASLAHRHPGLHITSDRLPGRAAVALTEAARESGVLVLGSRGLGRAAGYLLGSVATAVVARAERPVILVRAETAAVDEHRPDADGNASTATPYRDVVVGLELGDRPADSVLEFAFEAAERRSAALRVVHGRKGATTTDDPGELVEGESELLAESLRPWQRKFPGVRVIEEAVVGTAGSHLVDASRDASLVVVGRPNRPAPVGPHVGAVTHQMLQQAAAPVAVVPHD